MTENYSEERSNISSLKVRVIWISCVFFGLMFLTLLASFYRVVIIQTVERSQWKEVAQKRQVREETVWPYRGDILTDDGQIWATSLSYYSLYVDTRIAGLRRHNNQLYTTNIKALCQALADRLGGQPSDYRTKLDNSFYERHGCKRGNVLLCDHEVSYLDLLAVKEFPMLNAGRYTSGFFYKEHKDRINLFGALADRTIGGVNSLFTGAYGIELKYNDYLRGEPGLRKGLKIYNSWMYETEKPPVAAKDVKTTLNIQMQDVVSKALKENLERYDAEIGCCLVMEVKTGQIKASANFTKINGTYREALNMAVSDMSEPGSTFKTVSMMIALDDGVCEPEDTVDTEQGRYRYYNTDMTDYNWRHGGYGKITLAKAIAVSSNIGISRMINENYARHPADFLKGIDALGVFDSLGIEIPGAGVPRFKRPGTKDWSGIALPWLSVGYNSGIPPIYMLAFYNGIANGGKIMKPYYVQEIMNNRVVEKRFKPEVINAQMCKSSTLNKIKTMLEGVVAPHGTGSTLISDVVKIAGKSGTAQIGYGKRGQRMTHQVSFVGYFPADNPRYTAICVIKNPHKGGASGGHQAGRVIKEVAEHICAINNFRSIDEVVTDSNRQVFPYCFAGEKKNLEEVLDVLDYDYNFPKVSFIKPEMKENEISGRAIKTSPKLVPDVIGMGATDAIYLINKCGMHVSIRGCGKVVRQSVDGGTPVSYGTVYLTLR